MKFPPTHGASLLLCRWSLTDVFPLPPSLLQLRTWCVSRGSHASVPTGSPSMEPHRDPPPSSQWSASRKSTAAPMHLSLQPCPAPPGPPALRLPLDHTCPAPSSPRSRDLGWLGCPGASNVVSQPRPQLARTAAAGSGAPSHFCSPAALSTLPVRHRASGCIL